MAARILVVDDDADHRQVLRDKLEYSGYEVETAESAEDALGKLKAFNPALVITDVRMPGLSGLDLLDRVREGMEGVDVVVVTGHEDMSSAVSAMKAGAFDYVVKPVDLKSLEGLVDRCLKEQDLNARMAEQDREEAEQQPPQPQEEGAVVGRDPRMIEIYKMIGVLARNRATVLIRGETGSGKEMIARAIHAHSAHAPEPFIPVNCTALSESLLESELFGHVKGAFTGATSSRKGYFELAGSGTVFLDEIGDTSPEFQTKLLRVLQERKFFPVGGEAARTTEARVIAATHQPIERLVQQGDFREDLYFRLRVVEVLVPPLRERREDIPLLAEHLLSRIRRETHGTARHIAKEAMARLTAYDWPGNVRELENALTRAAILARGSTIGPEHLTLGVEAVTTGSYSSQEPDALTLDEVIARHVERVLQSVGGNKSQAARTLEISRSRLARILERLDTGEEDDGGGRPARRKAGSSASGG